MKKHVTLSKLLSVLILVYLVLVGIAVIAAIFLAVWPFNDADKWKEVLYDLITNIFRVILVTGSLSVIGMIFEKKLFGVFKNDLALRNAGINHIGANKSTYLDVARLLGNGISYPTKVKIMSITFNQFLHDYEDKIRQCVEHGCKIQLLLVSKESVGKFITNNEEMKNLKKGEIIKQVKDSLMIIDKINNECGGNGGHIEVRHYKDEFRNNLRIAYYDLPNCNAKINYWITIEALKNCAKDFAGAVTLYGQITDKNEDKNNIFLNYEGGFNSLWNKYKHTSSAKALRCVSLLMPTRCIR